VIVAAAVAIILTVIILLTKIMLPKFRAVQGQVDSVNRVTDEGLTGIRVVRAFNAEKYQEDKFEKVNTQLMNTNLFTARTMAFMSPVISFVTSLLSLAIYYVGAILVDSLADPAARAAQFGDLVVFSSYAMHVVISFILLSSIFMFLPRAQVSARRINEVLDQHISVTQGELCEQKRSGGTLEFRSVYFKYPGSSKHFLSDISFTVNRGETLAIVGATGSGKSTLVGLAARLYDVSQGEILLDGKNIKEYSFETLYNKIGYIPQKAVMFSDTIANNISFGKTSAEVAEGDILRALDIAQGSGFVSEMDEGIASAVAQGGTNLSGGQKQRLSIARVIARKPEILIFDDSFSALDFSTDRMLRKRIKEDLADTTCVVVASRIGTVKNADRILVLDDGAIAGLGSHSELMENCRVYREIALSQLSSEELKA